MQCMPGMNIIIMILLLCGDLNAWLAAKRISSYSHDDDRSTMVNKMDGGD